MPTQPQRPLAEPSALAHGPQTQDPTNNLYLKKDDYAQMWQKALKVDYVPVCDVRIIKPNKEKNKSAFSF